MDPKARLIELFLEHAGVPKPWHIGGPEDSCAAWGISDECQQFVDAAEWARRLVAARKQRPGESAKDAKRRSEQARASKQRITGNPKARQRVLLLNCIAHALEQLRTGGYDPIWYLCMAARQIDPAFAELDENLVRDQLERLAYQPDKGAREHQTVGEIAIACELSESVNAWEDAEPLKASKRKKGARGGDGSIRERNRNRFKDARKTLYPGRNR